MERGQWISTDYLFIINGVGDLAYKRPSAVLPAVQLHLERMSTERQAAGEQGFPTRVSTEYQQG